MTGNDKWAAFDVARHLILTQLQEVSAELDLEEAKTEPNPARIAALEAEIDALDLKYSFIAPDDFSG